LIDDKYGPSLLSKNLGEFVELVVRNTGLEKGFLALSLFRKSNIHDFGSLANGG
jgi:hypothetical protein